MEPQEPSPNPGPVPAGSTPAGTTATDRLILLYTWAEGILLGRLTRIVAQVPGTTTGAAQVRAYARRLSIRVVQQLEQATPALVDAVMQAETDAGTRAAGAELERYPGPPTREYVATPHGTGGGGSVPPPEPPRTGLQPEEPLFDLRVTKATRAFDGIRADLTSELEDVRRRITRLDDDVYKAIAPQGAMALVADRAAGENATPVQAMGAAWQTFVRQGITGFTDKGGRNWSLSAYVEMAVRTAAHRAYLAADLTKFHALGVHLFTIPDEDHACPLCFPWQGRILIDDEHTYVPPAGVHYDATIGQARAEGLFHPNCRHPLVAYFPGVTKVNPQEWGPENADAYRATQQLRRLEVKVRKGKAAAQYAADPEAAQTGRRDARNAQQAIRDHLAQHPDLNRRPHREQPHLRMDQTRLPGQAI